MDLPDENRSWAEICDEELYESEARAIIRDTQNDECLKVTNSKNADRVEFAGVNESLEEGEIRDNSFVLPSAKSAEKTNAANSVSSSTPIKPQSSSKTLTKKKVDSLENSSESTLSYAKVLSRGTPPWKNSSKHRPNVPPTDDLSLTSHLDVFHVDSPQKKVDNAEPVLELFADEDTLMFSPSKSSSNEVVVSKNTKRPFMLIDSPARELRDQKLNFKKVAKSEVGSDVHSRKESDSSLPSTKRELEVNPEVLCRRQKQIDYGKNTLGYERYSKMIPKEKRTKGNPKTPPKHLKMSRRAWDGLIKNWRMKLHKWDPVSDGDTHDPDNVNSDQFSVSSEDPSSYDSSSVRSDSTVSTPKKCLSVAEGEDGHDAWSVDQGQTKKLENSERLWTRRPKSTDKSDDDDYLGCEPLTENCVKAYS